MRGQTEIDLNRPKFYSNDRNVWFSNSISIKITFSESSYHERMIYNLSGLAEVRIFLFLFSNDVILTS